MFWKSVLLAGIFGVGAVGCSFGPDPQVLPRNKFEQEEKKPKRYGFVYAQGYSNVYLREFSKLKFEKCDGIIDVPEGLSDLIDESKEFQFKDPKNKERIWKLIEIIQKEKRKKFRLNFNLDLEELIFESVFDMEPGRVIKLCAEIAARQIDYDLIYNGMEDEKTVDDFFRERRSECNGYTRVMSALFNFMKEINPGLRNIYLTKHQFSRFGLIDHDWNTVFVFNPRYLQIAQIDALELENGKENIDVVYKASDKFWKLKFVILHKDYRGIFRECEYLLADGKLKEYEKVYVEITKADSFYKRGYYKRALAEYIRQSKEYAKYDLAVDHYMLYGGHCYLMLGKRKKGEKLLMELQKKYPGGGYAQKASKFLNANVCSD